MSSPLNPSVSDICSVLDSLFPDLLLRGIVGPVHKNYLNKAKNKIKHHVVDKNFVRRPRLTLVKKKKYKKRQTGSSNKGSAKLPTRTDNLADSVVSSYSIFRFNYCVG